MNAKEYGKIWRDKNKDKIKAYRLKNKEKISQQEKEYRIKNRAKRTKQFRDLRFDKSVDDVYKYYSNSCWFCNSKEKTLHIHHKDGKGFNEFGNSANNSLSNLVLICSSCHIKLHMLIRDYNKGQKNV